jgi:aconitate hydratase
MPIYDAAMRYAKEGVPTIVIAGKEYGSGSSRDWAAKGPKLLGVRAVVAESFERIHRSNLIGMGLLPLQFLEGQNAETLGLTGTETYDIEDVAAALRNDATRATELTVRVHRSGPAAGPDSFRAKVRLDTPQEARYYENGGILPFVLRRLLTTSSSTRPRS